LSHSTEIAVSVFCLILEVLFEKSSCRQSAKGNGVKRNTKQNKNNVLCYFVKPRVPRREFETLGKPQMLSCQKY